MGASILAALVGLAVVDGWCAFALHQQSNQRAHIEKQYSDVNGIEHGLLSVDVWMGHLRRIVAHGIDRFALTEQQRRVVKVELEKGLDALLDEIQQLQPGSVKGKIAKAAVGMMALHEKIPQLAQRILDKAREPETRHQLKKLALEKVDEYAAESRDTSNAQNELGAYFARYHVDSRGEFNRVAMARAERLERSVRRDSAVLVASLLVVLVLCALVHHQAALGWLRRPVFAIAVVVALMALLASLSSPMIEVDARIRRVDFLLAGEHLRFDNQVLFYQSKSIFQVVRALFTTRRPDSMFVGVLILLFSILVPITKLISTELVVLGKGKLARNRVLEFLAFKTGKWSMADVLVVAIFMAYVGLKSILDSQLADLNVKTQSLASITTNQTSLQPPFVVFVVFVLFGLVLAELLKRSPGRRST